MNRDLFLAILSMDSYNRGYDARVSGLTESGSLGLANIRDFQLGEQEGWQSVGFYALAYDVGNVAGFSAGEQVISYRGTNFNLGDSAAEFFSSPLWQDVLNGWTVGLGNPGGQAALALDFYNAVNAEGVDPRAANITTTGHSLGGGLAGLTAYVYNQTAILFDHMPYGPVSVNLRDLAISDEETRLRYYGGAEVWALSDNGINAFSTEYEVLSFLRANAISGASTPLPAYAGPDLTEVDLHSMALLVNLMWAEDNVGNAWTSAGTSLWDAYFSKDTADSLIGIETRIGPLGDAVSTMQAAIAYSALEEGEMPFGNVGIRAMFDDAADLASLINGGGSWSRLDANWKDLLGKFAVRYAGVAALADSTVADLAAAEANAFSRLKGGIFTNDANAFTLWTSEERWTFSPDDNAYHAIHNIAAPLFDEAMKDLGFRNNPFHDAGDMRRWYFDAPSHDATTGLANAIRSELGIVEGEGQSTDYIKAFTILADGNSNVTAQEIPLGEAGRVVVYGSDGDNIISGSGNNNIILGGDGKDKIFGGGGSNLLIGGDGEDTVTAFGNASDAIYSHDILIIGDEVDDGANGAYTGDTLRTGSPEQPGSAEIFQFEIANLGTGQDRLDIVSFENSGNDWSYIDLGTDTEQSPFRENDRVNAMQSDEAVTIDLRLASAPLSNAGSGTITGNTSGRSIGVRGAESAVGSEFDDTLYAIESDYLSPGSNLMGFDGNDVIVGGNGADHLNGGEGDDSITVGQGDVAVGGAGADTFFLSADAFSDNGLLNNVFLTDFNPDEDQLVVDGIAYNGQQKVSIGMGQRPDYEIEHPIIFKTVSSTSSWGLSALDPFISDVQVGTIPSAKPFADGKYRDTIVTEVTNPNDGTAALRLTFVDIDITWKTISVPIGVGGISIVSDGNGGLVGTALNGGAVITESVQVNRLLHVYLAGDSSTYDSFFQHEYQNSHPEHGFSTHGETGIDLTVEVPMTYGFNYDLTDTVSKSGAEADSRNIDSVHAFNDSAAGQSYADISSGLGGPITYPDYPVGSFVNYNSGVSIGLPFFTDDFAFVANEQEFAALNISAADITAFGKSASLNRLGIIPDGAGVDGGGLQGPGIGSNVNGQFGRSRSTSLSGSSGSDLLWASAQNDILDLTNAIAASAPNGLDIAIGGGGDDEYRIDASSSRTILNEAFGTDTLGGGNDRIVALFDSTSVTVTNSFDSNNLRLVVESAPQGTPVFSEIELVGQLGSDQSRWIETIEFANGVTWTRNDLLAQVTASSYLSATNIADIIINEDSSSIVNIADSFADSLNREIEYEAKLADGNPLPDWASLDNGILNFTPPKDYNGSLDVTVSAKAGGDSASTNFLFDVTPVNDVPERIFALDDLTVTGGEAISFTIPADTFMDIDGDALSFTATLEDGSALPTWLSFDGVSFTGTAPADFAEPVAIKVTASDGNATADDTFAFIPVGEAPVVLPNLQTIDIANYGANAVNLDDWPDLPEIGRGASLVDDSWPRNLDTPPAAKEPVPGWVSWVFDETEWTITEGPYGEDIVSLKAGQTDADNNGGGAISNTFAVEGGKAYEYVYYFKRDVAANQGLRLGFAYGTVNNHQVIDNHTGNSTPYPYFLSADDAELDAALTGDKWYKAVGYVLPEGSENATLGSYGGVYDTETGEKVMDMRSFRWIDGYTLGTSNISQSASYGTLGLHTHFHSPSVTEIDELVIMRDGDKLDTYSDALAFQGIKVDGFWNYADYAVDNEARWANVVGPDGTPITVVEAGQFNDGANGGGNRTNRVYVDPTKVYKYTQFFRKSDLNKHNVYFAMLATSSNGVPAKQLLTDGSDRAWGTFLYQNPATQQASFEEDKWYKLVGYILPDGTALTDASYGGVYDAQTGAKVVGVNVPAYKWNAEAQDIQAYGRFQTIHDTLNHGWSTYFGKPEITALDMGDLAADNADPFGLTQNDRGIGQSIDIASMVTDSDGDITGYALDPDGLPAKGTVNIDAVTGMAEYLPYKDALGSDSFSVLVTDATGNQVAVPVDINLYIPNVNQAPNIPEDGFMIVIDENSASGVIAGTITTTDPDGDTNIDYSFAGSLVTQVNGKYVTYSHDGRFHMERDTGNVIFNGGRLDYEFGDTSFAYDVKVADKNTGWDSRFSNGLLVISVNDLADSQQQSSAKVSTEEVVGMHVDIRDLNNQIDLLSSYRSDITVQQTLHESIENEFRLLEHSSMIPNHLVSDIKRLLLMRQAIAGFAVNQGKEGLDLRDNRQLYSVDYFVA